jgi:HAMP domain-containing protein
MDIRTKLVFALVAVSLGSMLALAALTYGEVRALLRDIAVRQLDAVAESKKRDVSKVIAGWHDRVALITSRTQMRLDLREFRRTRDPEIQERIRRTLDDALRAVPALRGIELVTPDGYSVAATGLAEKTSERVHPSTFWAAEAPLVYQNVSLDPGGHLLVAFVAPVRLDGALIGAAKVLLSADELIDVTQDWTGLGESGETFLARRTEDGGALVLNPLRHDREATLRREIGPEHTDDPAIQAVTGREDVWREGATDYRGHEVWAATRYLDEFGWGLVVKMDTAEESRAVADLRSVMGRVSLSLSSFAIVAGTLLGLYFARPIRALADVANRIRHGEVDLRADARAEDEIGQLARTFNEMTEELVDKHRALERRIRENSTP